MNAEREARREFSQRGCGALAAGQAVGDDADMMTALDLSGGKVEDMAKDD